MCIASRVASGCHAVPEPSRIIALPSGPCISISAAGMPGMSCMFSSMFMPRMSPMPASGCALGCAASNASAHASTSASSSPWTEPGASSGMVAASCSGPAPIASRTSAPAWRHDVRPPNG